VDAAGGTEPEPPEPEPPEPEPKTGWVVGAAEADDEGAALVDTAAEGACCGEADEAEVEADDLAADIGAVSATTLVDRVADPLEPDSDGEP